MSPEQLQEVLREETEALRSEALQNRGQIAEEKSENLERLLRLAEIDKQTHPPPPQKPRRNWSLAITLGAALLFVSILLFVRLPKTEIELDLELTDLQFVIAKEVLLTNEMRLSALGVSELREIRLPRLAPFKAEGGKGIAIRLSVAETENGENDSIITLRDVLLPAETRVWINSTRIPNQYRVSLEIPEGEALDLQVSIQGTIDIAPGVPVEQLSYSIPKTIHMVPASQQLNLDLTLSGETEDAFSSYLPLRDLGLIRIEEYRDTKNTYIRRVPTVLSGTLYLAELNGKKYPLREGEALRFERSEGQIWVLQPKENHLALKFHGQVAGMTTGWEDTRISLMPTCLEWLQARHGLGLLWGTSLFLFGIINRVKRWWKGE